MSRDTQILLDAFEHLPAEEKRSFADAILRRLLPRDSGPLPDEEIGARFRGPGLPHSMGTMPTPRRGEVWLIDFGLVLDAVSRSARL